MKIIKRGNSPKKRIWHGTCIYCGTMMEGLREELSQIKDDCRNGEYGEHKCPVCHNIIHFYPTNRYEEKEKYSSGDMRGI